MHLVLLQHSVGWCAPFGVRSLFFEKRHIEVNADSHMIVILGLEGNSCVVDANDREELVLQNHIAKLVPQSCQIILIWRDFYPPKERQDALLGHDEAILAARVASPKLVVHLPLDIDLRGIAVVRSKTNDSSSLLLHYTALVAVEGHTV